MARQQTVQEWARFPGGAPIRALGPEARLAVCINSNGTFTVHSIPDMATIASRPTNWTSANALTFYPEGRHIAIAARNRPVFVYDLDRPNAGPLQFPAPPGAPYRIALSGGARRLAREGALALWSVPDRRHMANLIGHNAV